MGDILGVAKISDIFLGCLKFMIFFFGVNGRCWVRAYVCRKNESTPPPPWDDMMHVHFATHKVARPKMPISNGR